MGIGIWQLVIILVIVLVLFGAKRLRNVGSDLGAAVKGFKNAVKEEDTKTEQLEKNESAEGTTIEGEVQKKQDKA